MNNKVEFSMGWTKTGFVGVKEKKPNKSNSRGKQKLKPISGSVLTQNKEIKKGGTDVNEGMWKIIQSLCTSACTPLDVEFGLKRKFEGINRDVGEVQIQEKKKRMVDDNDCVEAAVVARQHRRDQ